MQMQMQMQMQVQVQVQGRSARFHPFSRLRGKVPAGRMGEAFKSTLIPTLLP